MQAALQNMHLHTFNAQEGRGRFWQERVDAQLAMSVFFPRCPSLRDQSRPAKKRSDRRDARNVYTSNGKKSLLQEEGQMFWPCHACLHLLY